MFLKLALKFLIDSKIFHLLGIKSEIHQNWEFSVSVWPALTKKLGISDFQCQFPFPNSGKIGYKFFLLPSKFFHSRDISKAPFKCKIWYRSNVIPYFSWIWEWELTLKIENSQFFGKGWSNWNPKFPILWILADFYDIYEILSSNSFWNSPLPKLIVKESSLYQNRIIFTVGMFEYTVYEYTNQYMNPYLICTLTRCAT